MIQGIQIELTGAKLAEWLAKRADFYRDRADRIRKRIAALDAVVTAEEEEEEANLAEASYMNTTRAAPVLDQRRRFNEAKRKEGYFRLLAENVVQMEIYRLSQQDLGSLELVEQFIL